MTFQLDTTGGVGPMPGWHKPVPTSNRFIFWFDLSPFAQDYIEALAADNFARVAAMPSDNDETGHCRHCGRDNRGEEDGPCSDDCPRQDIRFSDFAPETLERIIADCERFQLMYPTAATTIGGKGLWTERQAGGLPRFPPQTLQLCDDGKVRFA